MRRGVAKCASVVSVIVCGCASEQRAAASEHEDDRELDAFVDGIVREHMESDGVVGVAVAVVDAERVLLVRGWGKALRR